MTQLTTDWELRAPRAPASMTSKHSNKDGDDRVRPAKERHVFVAIVGSGFSGLATAVELKRRGIDDFVVLERAASLGGTWRDNTYPGCACDVPSHLYSFSFAPKHDWSRAFAPQPEIRAYLEQVADRFD